MDKNTIQVKTDKVKNIYKEYLEKLSILEKERKNIIDNFVKVLENKRIEEIKNKLQSL